MRTVCALPRREACRGYPCVGAAWLLLRPSEPRQRVVEGIPHLCVPRVPLTLQDACKTSGG